MSNIFEIVSNIIISGIIVTLVSYISIYFNPLIASIIWSFPISFFTMAYVMHSKKCTNKQIAKLYLNILLLIFPLFLVTMCIYLFFYYSNNNTIIYPIIKTSIVWLIISVIFYGTINIFELNSYLE